MDKLQRGKKTKPSLTSIPAAVMNNLEKQQGMNNFMHWAFDFVNNGIHRAPYWCCRIAALLFSEQSL